jgi:serine/threonine protein kinase
MFRTSAAAPAHQLRTVPIPCRLVRGSQCEKAHTWNVVSIDSVTFVVDVMNSPSRMIRVGSAKALEYETRLEHMLRRWGQMEHALEVERKDIKATNPLALDRKHSKTDPSCDRKAESHARRFALDPANRMDRLLGLNVSALGPSTPLPSHAQGGMGSVSTAMLDNRKVLIKTYDRPSSLTGDAAVGGVGRLLASHVHQFLSEVWTLSTLAHPNIVTVLSVSFEPALLVLEYVDGVSLQQYIAPQPSATATASAPAQADVKGPSFVDWKSKARILFQVASAVEAMHSPAPGCDSVVVHRDLKPANVVIERGTDRAVVCDFGFATRCASTEAKWRPKRSAFTLGYAAPEQLPATPPVLTSAVDIYAFGAIIYFLISRRPPPAVYARADWAKLDLAAVSADGPRCLGSLMQDCMQFEPEKRPKAHAIVQRFRDSILYELSR